MTRDFSEVMSQRTDRELAEILTTRRHEYQEEAVHAALKELHKRNLDVNDFISVADMKTSETQKAPVPIDEKRLSALNKFLTLILPFPITGLWVYFCTFGMDEPIFRALSFPLVILVQVAIFKKLKADGYSKLSLDFKLWCLNSWVFLVVLTFVVFIIESFLLR